MRYGIVGIGNLGSALAVNIDLIGLKIGGMYSSKDSSIDNVNKILISNYKNSIDEAILLSDIIFLTVQDSEIENLAALISNKYSTNDLKNKLFIHTSGLKSKGILNKLKQENTNICSLHPIQSFPDRCGNKEALMYITCGFEGDEKALEVLEEFTTVFKMDIIRVASSDKPLYHACAVIMSNMMSALSYMGEIIFEKLNIDRKIGYKAYEPLMKRTLENILNNGAVAALSGPVSRGDVETISEHLKEIKKNIPQIAEAYTSLTKIAAEMAYEKETIDIQKLNDIIKVIEDIVI